MNRATFNGAIEIGRNPRVVTVTFLAPKQYLKDKGMLGLVQGKYRFLNVTDMRKL